MLHAILVGPDAAPFGCEDWMGLVSRLSAAMEHELLDFRIGKVSLVTLWRTVIAIKFGFAFAIVRVWWVCHRPACALRAAARRTTRPHNACIRARSLRFAPRALILLEPVHAHGSAAGREAAQHWDLWGLCCCGELSR